MPRNFRAKSPSRSGRRDRPCKMRPFSCSRGAERWAEGVEIHALCSSPGVLGQNSSRERQVQLNRSFSAETGDFGQL
jgi:hypothetical protein